VTTAALKKKKKDIKSKNRPYFHRAAAFIYCARKNKEIRCDYFKQRLWELVMFRVEWQFNMAISPWVTSHFTNWLGDWNGSCSGRPLTVTCVEAQGQIDRHILDNRRLRINEIASELIISHGKKIWQKCLGFTGEHFIPLEWEHLWTAESNALKVERLGRHVRFSN
jgi:hypothetical protein